MARRTAAATTQNERIDLYQEITDGIIADLEAGCPPWVRPWSSRSASSPMTIPQNAATGRPYSGINILLLWRSGRRQGFARQKWLTFQQTLAAGGNVRKGERGTTAVFANQFTPERERERAERDGDTPGAIPFLKRFTVFNVAQCEGLEADPNEPPYKPAHQLIPEADALIAATGADLRLGGPEAYYVPRFDYIQMPKVEDFPDPLNWYATAFHELVHYSGHETRLNRDLSGDRGGPDYAREELVAELGASFVCTTLGITPTVRHAGYIDHWLKVLREDKRAVIKAASAASKAADFILAFRDADPPGRSHERTQPMATGEKREPEARQPARAEEYAPC